MGNVTFLGVEGSGKTVLTMALINAFAAHEYDGWFLRPETRSAFRFLEQCPQTLTKDSLPHQTTSLRYLAWSVVKDNVCQQTLDILDYPGEVYRLAFLNAEDESDPDSFNERVRANQEEINALLNHLIKSEQIFVLFNLADAVNLEGNAANLDAVWVTNACLDYLHRLPHHPRVTLLLTQFDRYFDAYNGGVEPKEYLKQFLPLIYRNFPNLDVCAVAALGAADSHFGIDSILLRSLFNSPAVQEPIGLIQARRKELKKVALGNFMNPQYCSRLVSALMSLSSDAPEWKAYLPWFIDVKKLISSNGLLAAHVCEECKAIVGEVFVHLTKARYNRLISVESYLRRMTPRSEEAQYLIRVLLRVVKQAEERTAKAEKEEQNRNWAIFFCILAGIALFVVFIVVLASA